MLEMPGSIMNIDFIFPHVAEPLNASSLFRRMRKGLLSIANFSFNFEVDLNYYLSQLLICDLEQNRTYFIKFYLFFTKPAF